MNQDFDLDTALLSIPNHGASIDWTIRDAVEGVQIFGGIGSGKTSGSGRTIALKFLASGFGGLVLTAKHDEKLLWQDYCKISGRTDDLIIIEPGGGHSFNFLEYESATSGDKQSLTLNIVQVLKTVIRAKETKNMGKSDDRFWETALDLLMANLIDLCMLAYGKVTIQLLYDLAQSAPKLDGPQPVQKTHAANDDKGSVTTPKPAPKKVTPYERAYDIALKRVSNLIRIWKNKQSKDFLETVRNNETVYAQHVMNAIPEARTLEFVHDFFEDSFKQLASKTRSIIDFSVVGFLYALLREPTYSLFCSKPSTVTPEDSLNGKIILINLPVKDYQGIGQDCQIMFKYIWQRSMERRRINENNRPVFLWADEAQNFLHEHDADYQATARSSRIATVYISQNLPNYFANMGGESGQYKVKSFLGTLGTKVFHANADHDTNAYASKLIGEAYFSNDSNTATMAGEFSSSRSSSVILESQVRPEEFVSLKTGGPKNDFRVQAILHFQGKQFRRKESYKKMFFSQLYSPIKQ